MKKQTTPGAIADQLLDRNDQYADFWREYLKADQEGGVTPEMVKRGEELLRQQDQEVKQFLQSISK